MKKYIPRTIGVACIAALAAAAFILTPGIRKPQSQKPEAPILHGDVKGE